MDNKPLWRRLFDAAEKKITPRAEEFVQTEKFARGSTKLMAYRRRIRNRIERSQAYLLHLGNLPAGTDVRKLRRQIGDLDRQVRQLSMELEKQRAREHKQRMSREE